MRTRSLLNSPTGRTSPLLIPYRGFGALSSAGQVAVTKVQRAGQNRINGYA
jgi:hypothetical protein